MTIYTQKDLLKRARILPGKHGESMKWQLEDIIAQLEIWEKTPEKLDKDKETHKGINRLARVMLGMEPKKVEKI